MPALSQTYVTALVALLAALGLKLSTDDVSTTLNVLVLIGSFLYHLVLRHQKGGVTWYGKKN